MTTPCLPVNNPLSVNAGSCLQTYYNKGNQITVQSPFGNLGSQLPYSPNFQADLRVRFDWYGGSGTKWFTSLGIGYTGPTYNPAVDVPSGDTLTQSTHAGPNGVIVPGTTLLRYHMAGYAIADFAIGIARDSWKASLFADNFTDSHASTFTSSAQYIKSEVPVRPATYGIKIGYDF